MDLNNILSVNIKLEKQIVMKQNKLKDKTISLLCYLFFHTTCEHKVYTTIDTICKELNLSLNSHNKRNNQSVIKELLHNLIEKNIISFLPTEKNNTIEQITNNQIFTLMFNEYDQYINIPSGYVALSITEYNTILENGKENFFKLLNIYCKIKSYVCMDDYCMHICYPSIKTICTDLKCSDNTFFSLLKILCDSKLIYLYHFTGNDQIKNNYGQIEYVFSLEEYDKNDIRKQFIP